MEIPCEKRGERERERERRSKNIGLKKGGRLQLAR